MAKKTDQPALDPTRRTALKGLGAAALTRFAPGCAPGAGEGPEDAPHSLEEAIDTVVVLMMENRTFDHFLGALSLEGRQDVDGLAPGMSNPDADGNPVEIHPADQDCIADPPHGWDDTHRQWNEGANDGFVTEHARRHGPDEAHRVMGYWDRASLSAYYALADHYTICNRWFCSLLGPTLPNRLYAMAAQSGGRTSNVQAPLWEPSIFDRLDAAGIGYGGWFGNASMAVLFPQALENGSFEPMSGFWRAAENGWLPPVTFIEPIYGTNDDHPPAHPVAGQVLVSAVYKALAESPKWDSTLLLITYDEHGGFFDHVPPPTIADPRAEEGFGQMGFRVPTIAVGPYVKERFASDVVFDHTSILRFIERRFGLEPLNERDAAANDLDDLLDWDRIARLDPRPPVPLPVIEADDEVLYREDCVEDLLRDGRGLTGQPELEAIYDALPSPHPTDRRAQTARDYEAFLARAEAMGVLRRR